MSEHDNGIPGNGRDLQPVQSAGSLDSLDFELLAASLRADASDMPVWFALLGTKLAEALPERVQLHRSGLFSSGAVKSIEIELGAWRLALRLEHGYPLAERTHVVRGIGLKTEQLPLDDWITSLCQALSELAATSVRENAAIQSLLR